MPRTGIPSRRATSAWPSSCSTSDAKYPIAPATATKNAVWTEPPIIRWKNSVSQ